MLKCQPSGGFSATGNGPRHPRNNPGREQGSNRGGKMNDTARQPGQRLEVVELKLMDLEHTISELNDVIITQYSEIDRLKENQDDLRLRLAQIDAETDVDLELDTSPPPHY